jgi:hypothetical protein
MERKLSMGPSQIRTQTSSNPEDVRKTLTSLRRLVRLGKMAEKALSQLQQGKLDVKSPVFHLSVRGYSHGSIQGNVKIEKFIPAINFNRSMISSYGDWTLRFGGLDFDTIGNHKTPCMTVYIEGPGLHIPRGHAGPYANPIGSVHMKKNGMNKFNSWNENSVSIHLKKNVNKIESHFLPRISKQVALIVMRELEEEDDESVHEELSRRLSEWLIQDGFIHRWLHEINNACEVQRVMAA